MIGFRVNDHKRYVHAGRLAEEKGKETCGRGFCDKIRGGGEGPGQPTLLEQEWLSR